MSIIGASLMTDQRRSTWLSSTRSLHLKIWKIWKQKTSAKLYSLELRRIAPLHLTKQLISCSNWFSEKFTGKIRKNCHNRICRLFQPCRGPTVGPPWTGHECVLQNTPRIENCLFDGNFEAELIFQVDESSNPVNLKEIALTGVYSLLDHKNASQYVLLQKYCIKALGNWFLSRLIVNFLIE